jgi:hypothetical protein
VVVITAFGDDGRGGVFTYDGTSVEQIDTLASTGLAVADGRVARLLHAADGVDSVAELLVYDERGVVEYRRLDAMRDPHDISSDDDGWLIVSSADNALYRLERGGDVHVVWRGSTVHDSWHPNCVARTNGDVWITAFGRFDVSRGWGGPAREGAGFLLNLRSQQEFGALTHPHSPRFVDGAWWVCSSGERQVVCLDPDTGRRRAQVTLAGYTRGMAVHGDLLFVGESQRRDGAGGADASVALVSRRALCVTDRFTVPALEIYDVVLVPSVLVEGLRCGFDTNLQRVAAQASRDLLSVVGSFGDEARCFGKPLPREALQVQLTGDISTSWRPRESRRVRVSVTNLGSLPLASVLPHPTLLGARWLTRQGQQIDCGRCRLGGVLRSGDTAELDLEITAPDDFGPYRLSISLVQEGIVWFDDADEQNGLRFDVVVDDYLRASIGT